MAWEIVRGRRVLGLKFRRQQVVDGFIVDLLCVEIGVVIEIDGGIHETPEGRAYEECRSAVITTRGWRELRVSNNNVTPEHLRAMLLPWLPLSGRPAGSNGEGAGGHRRQDRLQEGLFSAAPCDPPLAQDIVSELSQDLVTTPPSESPRRCPLTIRWPPPRWQRRKLRSTA